MCWINLNIYSEIWNIFSLHSFIIVFYCYWSFISRWLRSNNNNSNIFQWSIQSFFNISHLIHTETCPYIQNWFSKRKENKTKKTHRQKNKTSMISVFFYSFDLLLLSFMSLSSSFFSSFFSLLINDYLAGFFSLFVCYYFKRNKVLCPYVLYICLSFVYFFCLVNFDQFNQLQS